MHMVMAFAVIGTLEDSRIVHKQLIQSGCESDVSVRSRFIGMYAKCGSMEDAWRVFKKIHLKILSLGPPCYWYT